MSGYVKLLGNEIVRRPSVSQSSHDVHEPARWKLPKVRDYWYRAPRRRGRCLAKSVFPSPLFRYYSLLPVPLFPLFPLLLYSSPLLPSLILRSGKEKIIDKSRKTWT